MSAHPQLQDSIRRLLDQAKQLGADQAEISASIESGFSVNARLGDVETLEHHQEKNLQITVYRDHRSGTTSTSDLSADALQSALTKAFAIANYTEQDACAGLADAALMATHYPDLQLSYPWDLTPKQAIDMAIQCDQVARAQDKRIKNSEGASVSTDQAYEIYANSHGFIGTCHSSQHSMSCSVIAETKKEMQRDYEYTVARDAKKLHSVEWVGQQAAMNTINRLGARKIHTQRCPIIFHSRVARGLLGNFVSAISGYQLYRRMSFLCDQLGSTLFPKEINIYQDPHLIGEMGSSPFDDEGVATKKIDYVKRGVLQSYVLGSYSARKLGLQTTGNSGGVFNLFINHSDDDLPALCKTMGTGLMVTELIGQGVNLMTGDYSRGAFGFWIDKGEIQYPVEEITIAGNLRDMFLGIQQIGNDVDHRGNIKTGSILVDQMTVAGH